MIWCENFSHFGRAVVAYSRWMFACITKRTTSCKAFVFLNGTLKRVFTFVSPLFVCNWYTSPLSYLDSAKKEYNCQSHKPSTSVTERTLSVVVDCIKPHGNAKSRKPYYRRNADNNGKTTRTTMRVRAGLSLNFPFEYLKETFIRCTLSLLKETTLNVL